MPLALRGFLEASPSSNFGGTFARSAVSLLPVFSAFLTGQKHSVRSTATTGNR